MDKGEAYKTTYQCSYCHTWFYRMDSCQGHLAHHKRKGIVAKVVTLVNGLPLKDNPSNDPGNAPDGVF